MQLLTQILKQINDYVWGTTTYLSVIRDRYLLYLQIKIDPTYKIKISFLNASLKNKKEMEMSVAFKLYVLHFLQR